MVVLAACFNKQPEISSFYKAQICGVCGESEALSCGIHCGHISTVRSSKITKTWIPPLQLIKPDYFL